jgi:23S rRNA (cytosine1962-C5)-methyltransferase
MGMGNRWHDAVVTTIPRVRLRKELARSLRAGHPWIYADALEAPSGLPTGSVVDVVGREGRFLARGLYDARSPIAVRVATLDRDEAVDEALVRRRVEAALAARRDLVDPETTDAFRWLNGEGDLLPGVVVDVYARVAVLRLDGEAVRVWREAVARAVAQIGRPLGIEHVFERSRGQVGEPLAGGPPPVPVEIREHGVRFAVDVVKGQKTGFFLDQRENRHLVRGLSSGKEVVNLFAYTGGFSVYAALGGARRVVTVDSAAGAVAQAEANFALNGLAAARHKAVCADAFAWLDEARRAGRRFELVIVDPPSFAPSEKALPRAVAAYRDLLALALGVLAPAGLVAAASCSSHVGLDDFLGALRDAADKARRPLRLHEVRGQPGDHPSLPAFPEGRYLKFVLARAIR